MSGSLDLPKAGLAICVLGTIGLCLRIVLGSGVLLMLRISGTEKMTPDTEDLERRKKCMMIIANRSLGQGTSVYDDYANRSWEQGTSACLGERGIWRLYSVV